LAHDRNRPAATRRSVLNPRNDIPGKITDGIIQGGFLFLILVTPLLFGSVYPWAYSMIEVVTALMMGAWLVRLLLLGRSGSQGVPNRKIFPPAILFFALILFQLTPLPPRVLQFLSPETATLYTTFLSDAAPGSAARAEPGETGSDADGPERKAPGNPASILEEEGQDSKPRAHTLSLARDRTRREGMLFLSYVGLLYLLINYKPEGSVQGFLRRILSCIVAAGILVALIGIVQKVMGASRVYGFWQPLHISRLPFMGPYINANHFAGYIELVLPLVIAMFFAWATGMKRSAPSGTIRVVEVLQSPENNKIVLGLLGIGIMTATLFLSFSRAGITSFLLTLFLLFLVLGRMENRFRPDNWKKIRGVWRLSFIACFLLLVAFALVVFLLKRGGLEGIPKAARFQVWHDTGSIAMDFPLFGVGLNCFSVIFPTFKTTQLAFHFTHTENDYLQMLAETGGIGLGLVLLFFVFFIRETANLFQWRTREFLANRNAPQETGEALEGRRLRYSGSGKERIKPTYPLPRTNYFLFWGCAGSLLSLALHSLADFNLHIPANGILFFLLLGIMYRLLRLRLPVFSFASRRFRNR